MSYGTIIFDYGHLYIYFKKQVEYGADIHIKNFVKFYGIKSFWCDSA